MRARLASSSGYTAMYFSTKVSAIAARLPSGRSIFRPYRTARRMIRRRIYPWSVLEGTMPFSSPIMNAAVRT